MSEETELAAAAGFVDPAVQEEFPGLRLDWLTLEGRMRDSPPDVAKRLRALSSRYRGANVIAMRTQPIPHAYRTFFRQIGLDPDTRRVPSEDVAVTRLLDGQFRSRNLIQDALLIALIETGVPVWALNADLVDAGGLGIRPTATGERLGSVEPAHHLPPGRLVVADAVQIHAVLFGDVAPGHVIGSGTTRIALFTVGVDGVPAIHIEEALWIAVETMRIT